MTDDDQEDEMQTCPSCDAEFQVIVNAANPACRSLKQGGCRYGFFCPCCGFEFEEADEDA